MATIIWAHLCHYAYIDSAGMTSIIAEFDTLRSKSFPYTHAQIYSAVKIAITGGEMVDFKVKIISSTGQLLIESPGSRASRPVGAAAGTHLFIDVLLFTEFPLPGEYAVELIADDVTVHTLPLYIALTI